MQISALKDAWLQYLLLGFTPRRVASILVDTTLFFIVGMGRSGTMFLSRLLNQVPELSVYHEIASDRDALVDAYWSPDKSSRYLVSFRARRIAARIVRDQKPVYGEVNSYLRYHVDALKSIWQPDVLHLSRDGRAVVRSIMNRKSFTPDDKDHTGRLAPHPGDPFAYQWASMDRFARICWYWATTNQYLLDRQLPVVRFEDIITSYEAFNEQVTQRLNVSLPYETWREEVARPSNVSQRTSFPSWEYWTAEQKCQFDDICGAVMTDLGYEN